MWRRETLIKIAAALVVIWVLAIAGVLLARAQKPSPEKVAALLERHRIADLSADDAAALAGAQAAERQAAIAQVTRELNRLDYNQRSQLRGQGDMDAFFQKLTLDEKKQFLEDTLPRGFEEMMRAFNAMEPTQRKRFVEQALQDMEEREAQGESGPAQEDPELANKIAEAGMEAYYESASADVKLDLAPIIERLQDRMQRVSGR